MAAKNLCAKTVKPDQAYEVWQVEEHPDYGGTWTWYVLKKYQSPEREAVNSYARWLCYVTFPRFGGVEKRGIDSTEGGKGGQATEDLYARI